VHRSLAGTIGASLMVQLSLVGSGVAAARLLGVVDRGHLALFNLIGTVLPIILTLGLPLALSYWIALSPQLGRQLLNRVRATIAWQLAALVVLHAVVLYVVFRNAPGYVQRAAMISLLESPAAALAGYGAAVLQGNQQFRTLNITRMISPPIAAAALFTFLVLGARSLLLATVTWTLLIWLTAIVTGLAALRGLHDETAPDGVLEVPSVRALLGFGSKALLGSVAPIEGFQLDQAIVGVFISPAALGIYVVGVGFTNLTRFMSQAIGIVAYPHVAAERDTRARTRSIIRFVTMALLLCGATVIGVEVAVPLLVPLLFGSAFHAAISVARILLISALFFGLRRVLNECSRGAGRPGLGSIAEIVSLVILLPAVMLLYGDGARGVAVALVIASGAGLASIVLGLLAWPLRAVRHDDASEKTALHTDQAAAVATGLTSPSRLLDS
jgi:O-antigen/teichoic acid export membrane protein